MKKSAAILLLFIFCFSCGRAESSILADNILNLLAKHQVSAGNMNCESDSGNRSGVCTFSTKPDQIEQLQMALSLRGDLPPMARARAAAGIAKCKKPNLGIDNREMKTYRSSEKISLDNGQAFEYLFLFYDPKSEEGCVEIQYSYG